jgi:ubiquinone/menaquinone biosynthesis C-methylase UbiE
MPAMSRLETAACRSVPWRAFTRRVVLPWALQGVDARGDVLELGAGSGAMAEQLLRTNPSIAMCVTDFDENMVGTAAARLERFGTRVTARQADATSLPFDDGSFDTVLSWIMLHHTIDWEKALAEAVRVLRPGGQFLGYDLTATGPLRWLHRNDDGHRMIAVDELRSELSRLPLVDASVRPAVGGIVMRFAARRREGAVTAPTASGSSGTE